MTESSTEIDNITFDSFYVWDFHLHNSGNRLQVGSADELNCIEKEEINSNLIQG